MLGRKSMKNLQLPMKKKYSMSIRLLTVEITVMRIPGLATHSFWKKAVSMERKAPNIKFCHEKSTSPVKKSR